MSDPKSDLDIEQEETPEAAGGAEKKLNGAEGASAEAGGMRLESFDDAEVDGDGEKVADPKDQEIERLKSELDQARDKLMRAVADIQNSRKRFERDRREAETFGGVKLARDVLVVYDNLAKALSVVSDEIRAQDAAFVEGLELTQRELLNAFAKHKIELVAPEKGEKFDPNRHQAMFEAPFGEPGAIVEVVQAGFMIADRLLRPALVGVGSAGARAETTTAADEGEVDADDGAPGA